MNRTDSGFDDAFRMKLSRTKPAAVQRSNTAPERPRRSKKAFPDLHNDTRSTATGTERPASEHHPNNHRKIADPQRKSTTSSSNNSTTKTRRRGHDSLPSSRRTSCTIVDPSRPARHYRINSSQTCPTASGHIDDALALHFRSCNLFRNASDIGGVLPSPKLPGYGPDADTESGSAGLRPRPGTGPHACIDNIESASPKENDDLGTTHALRDTTMHWMSPSTRKHEYAKIDRANSGFRGFLSRVVPRCVSGPPAPKFYENDKSDAGSVRRYRMDVSDDEEFDEKSDSALRAQRCKMERSRTDKTNTRRWGCF